MQGAKIEDGVVTNLIMLAGPDDAAVFGVLVCPDEVQIGWLFDGSSFVRPEPPAPTAADLMAHAATRRWLTETGGITVAGVPVYTDDRSKLLIHGARTRAESDPSAVESFAAADGQVHELDAAAITAISDAVGAHVSACFRRYGAVVGAIAAGDVTTLEDIDAAFADVAADWPT